MYFESVFQHSFRHSFTSHEGNIFLLHKIANAMFLAHLVQICHFEHPLGGGVSNGYRHPQRNQHLNFWNPLPTKTQQERYGTGFRHVNNHFTLTPSILPKPNQEGPPPPGTIISCSFLLSGERLVGDPIYFGRLSCHGETHMSRTVGRNETKTKQIYVFQMTSFAQ